MTNENRKNILVVEDDQSTLELYERFLTRMNYKVTSVLYEGEETKIPTGLFHGVILDGLYGNYQAVAEKFEAKKVFVISGNRGICEGAIKKGLKAVEKPINFSKLEEMIR